MRISACCCFRDTLLILCNLLCILGEFGVVYKGHIIVDQGRIVTETVAIKTLKGMTVARTRLSKSLLCIFLRIL